ncbi:adenosylcobinamide-GDP ribazoletransferase [Intrasporangium sp. YIM S08009]|uniref:adenosylcobinamide-GDP ribazoletransferase n=1 Tax=Intrasporangium zincisolvens TaxID=3080018 RepID=UPI002B05F1B7|nr:adenosylcobinamide-GDP ribazoletransferase [Intrasporangium sp. YIM S08009]
MRDAWRLAFGTFTALRVPPPASVGPRELCRALLLAPVTALVYVVAWVALGVAVLLGAVPAAVGSVLALVVVALGSRAFHLDGLADLVDGLTSGHDPARSLEVMRRGDTGPAGAAALVLVLGLDAAALTSLLPTAVGVALAAVALVGSRVAPAVCARSGVLAARPEGLGRSVAGTVSRGALVALVATCTVVGALATALAAETQPGVGVGAAVATVLGAATGALVVRAHAVRRLGGVTGDVVGAAVEVSLATALVVASVAVRLTS